MEGEEGVGSRHLRLLLGAIEMRIMLDFWLDWVRVKPQNLRVYEPGFSWSWHRIMKLRPSSQLKGNEELLEVAHLVAIIWVFCHPQETRGNGKEGVEETTEHLLCPMC